MDTLSLKMDAMGFNEPERRMDEGCECGNWPNPAFIPPGRVEAADAPMVLEATGTVGSNPFASNERESEVVLAEPVQYDPLDVVAPWVLPPGSFPTDVPIQQSTLDGSTYIPFDITTPSATLEESMARVQTFLKRYPPSLTPQSHGVDWITFDLRSPAATHQLETNQNIDNLKADFANLVSLSSSNLRQITQGDFRPAKNAHPYINPSSLDALAREHGVLSGKWLIFTDAARVDLLWAKVVSFVIALNSVQSNDMPSGDATYQQVYARVSTRKTKMHKVTKRRFGYGSDSCAQGGETEVIEEQPHVISLHTPNYLHQHSGEGMLDATTSTQNAPAHIVYLREALRDLCGVKWKIGFKPDAYTHLGIYRGNEWGVDVCRWFI
ncbi:hypothetical protein BKA70DRAFT_1245922 [Coprinopsis sp. MPI-PUGE-AT-0042]|nr:hypothetical protein BKA70DRAFT_1245922 [Coprinopsis sp. MPI-PUGE-AT-0042]